MQGHSLNRNLLAALNVCTARDEAIAIVEDDDWYAGEYLEFYVPFLERFSLVGQGHGLYYHVGLRRYRSNRQTGHSSLCSTLLRYEVVRYMKEAACKHRSPFIDKRLWRQPKLPVERHLVFDQPMMCVGIKGMPGRSGIGIGHKRNWMGRRGLPDPSMVTLRALIDNDVDLYEHYYQTDMHVRGNKAAVIS
jgi:hypothetical protein